MREHESCCGSGSAIISFLFGALVGAGVTLLLAPQTGEEARRRIMDFKDDLTDRQDDYVDAVKSNVQDVVQKGKDFIDDQKDVISSAVEAGKKAFKEEKDKQTDDA